MADRYEREIDEIVKKSGGDLGPRTPLRQAFKDFQHRLREGFTLQLPALFYWVTPTRVGGLGAVLLIAGMFVLRPYLVVLALALLLGAYLLSVARGSGAFKQATGYDKSWRGRSMEERGPSQWRSRLRRWFGRKG